MMKDFSEEEREFFTPAAKSNQGALRVMSPNLSVQSSAQSEAIRSTSALIVQDRS